MVWCLLRLRSYLMARYGIATGKVTDGSKKRFVFVVMVKQCRQKHKTLCKWAIHWWLRDCVVQRQTCPEAANWENNNRRHVPPVMMLFALRRLEYICSPTRYTKFLNDWVHSSHMLARHVSDLTIVHLQEPFLQAVCAYMVCANTRVTRHVQPLRSCKRTASCNFVATGRVE